MKRINTTKLMALLASLCLITSSFVGSTLAKYTTEVSGSDTARVAKFGVELTADANLFEKEYEGVNGISVKSDDDADVIAPGTFGVATLFTIAGAPEVDVEVDISLSNTNELTMATLPAGTYDDYTALVDSNTDGKIDANDTMNTFTLADNYYPVKWTLKKDGTAVATDVNLKAIEDYFEDMCGIYNVEDDDFANIVGTYELSWKWDFEIDDDTDKADTYMGQIAAGVVTAPTDYVANESFDFVLNVTQLD